LNSNPGQFYFVFLLPLFRSENRVCLSRGVQVAGAAWRAAMSTVVGVGDLLQRTRDGHTGRVLSGRTVERSSGALKPRSMVCEWFGLKNHLDGF
jgi:hypothetical protein